MNLETEMTDSNICDCGNIDIDEAIKIAEKFIKQARVDELSREDLCDICGWLETFKEYRFHRIKELNK